MSKWSVALGLAYVIVLLAIEVGWSPRYVARIKARIAAGDRDARRAMYRFSIAFEWGAAAIALLLLLAGGATLGQVGLQLPSSERFAELAPMMISAVVGIALGGIVAVRAGRRSQPTPTAGDIDVLIPRTRSERRWFAGLAVTAGTMEELLYRALPLIVLTQLLPSLSPWWVVAITAVAFGLVHIYQGLAGVVATAVLGALFGALFIKTQSLLPGMVLHTLIDLRVLLIKAPSPPTER